MGFFRSRREHQAPSPPTPAASVPSTDWADPEAVFAEWRNDREEPNWGAAWTMYNEGPVPGQRLNVAEYFTRVLKLALFDRTAMPDEQTAEVCRRVLVLLSEVPQAPAWIGETHRKFGPRLIRLPLAIMRDRGWQPVQYGGNGRVSVDIDVEPIIQAVATTIALDGRFLDHFFGAAFPTPS